MSNILNSCFFTLYKHGVKQNVEVNVEDDICIIFMLLESIKLDEIPFEDKESLNYIIKYLKKKIVPIFYLMKKNGKILLSILIKNQ